ncbi:hypothetical protein EVG20_g6573 [Dentipellis fragilis]|uniref:Uncharacterized protein n=1 Tax=Dentipellis fragilis TaxID=205917 RepID=A0A4Y9YLV6_9AGAM|nr:hypothetical protein EVG20_g6573 [Dentipellis fragilis]
MHGVVRSLSIVCCLSAPVVCCILIYRTRDGTVLTALGLELRVGAANSTRGSMHMGITVCMSARIFLSSFLPSFLPSFRLAPWLTRPQVAASYCSCVEVAVVVVIVITTDARSPNWKRTLCLRSSFLAARGNEAKAKAIKPATADMNPPNVNMSVHPAPQKNKQTSERGKHSTQHIVHNAQARLPTPCHTVHVRPTRLRVKLKLKFKLKLSRGELVGAEWDWPPPPVIAPGVPGSPRLDTLPVPSSSSQFQFPFPFPEVQLLINEYEHQFGPPASIPTAATHWLLATGYSSRTPGGRASCKAQIGLKSQLSLGLPHSGHGSSGLLWRAALWAIGWLEAVGWQNYSPRTDSCLRVTDMHMNTTQTRARARRWAPSGGEDSDSDSDSDGILIAAPCFLSASVSCPPPCPLRGRWSVVGVRRPSACWYWRSHISATLFLPCLAPTRRIRTAIFLGADAYTLSICMDLPVIKLSKRRPECRASGGVPVPVRHSTSHAYVPLRPASSANTDVRRSEDQRPAVIGILTAYAPAPMRWCRVPLI